MATQAPNLYRTLQVADLTGDEPTLVHYSEFQRAFSFFNKRLFSSVLDVVPECLVVMTRKPRSHGYLAPDKWEDRRNGELIHELSLNPEDFAVRSAEEVLGTLCHEMVHAWQFANGDKKPRRGYHNKEWAEAMDEVGLIPTSDGTEAGKRTGQRMTHLIDPSGEFARQAASLLDLGWAIPHIDVPNGEVKKKKKGRPKYTCPTCGIQAWGKPGLSLGCEECGLPLDEEEPEEDEAGALASVLTGALAGAGAPEGSDA